MSEGGSRTGEEFKASWQSLQREGEQICNFLSVEFEGALARGADNAEGLMEGESSRQEVTGQREELREAMLAKALKQHNDQAARPVRTYPQLDKLSTAWKLSLPGPTNGLSSSVFKEVMAQHLCLPSPACASIVGQRVGAAGVVDPFGDEVMTAPLPQDTWRTRHDVFKVEMVNIANEARVPIECEVFGEFRPLIPVQLMEDGGELGFCRQRAGLVPDFKLQLQSPEGPQHCLGELKFISAGVTRYPVGREEKQVDRRARELPGEYRRPLERLDRLHHGTGPGETGRLVAKLQSYGPLQGCVVGHWGEGSKDLHTFVQTCAEAKVAHLVRASGRQESEHLLGMVVGQYRRLLSTTAVRAQAMCLLARVGLVTPAAKEAAGRRELAMRLSEAMNRERMAQWITE